MPSLSQDEEYNEFSDADAEFQDDVEDLRRACLLTGANLDDDAVPRSFEASSPSASAASASATSDGDSDSEDDLELLRKLQQRFCDSVDSCEVATYVNPSSRDSAVLEDDDVDDFETLCAVRNRFAAYEANKLGDDALLEPGSDGVESVPSYSSFPEEAKLLVDAINRNRSCQKFLRSKIAHVEARMEENRKLVQRVKILKDFQAKCKRVAGDAFSIAQDPRNKLITAQKLNKKGGSAKCKGPVENSYVAKYRLAVPHFPSSLKQKPWSKEEREDLNKGLRQLFQETLFQASMDPSSESEGSPGDPSNLYGIASSIRDLEITPEQLREFIPMVNWDQLASNYVRGGRSGAECEARWLNFEDQLINQNPWTKQEEKLILHIVQERGMTNWINIATSLGTNRTPFDCLAHFQRSLNAYILKREWTSEEDDQLRAAVQVIGESNWQRVAATLPGRTGVQCSNRWLKSIHPSLSRKGKWKMDEDKRLKVAVKLFGPKNWQKIAQFVPGRRQSQCRERWVNSLDPSLKRGEWTEEEDSKLKAGIEEFGHCWSKIAAKFLPHRTDNLCLRRWKVLFPDDMRLVQAARRIKKFALRSNFVDYEEYRPALGISDFMQLPMITAGTEAGNTVPAKKCQRKSRKLKNSTTEENGDSVVAPGKGANMTSGTEPENTVPAKKRKRKSRELKNSTTEENGDAVVAPVKGAKITSGTEPGNTVLAMKRKRKSRELNNSIAEENGDAVVAPVKGAKKLRPKRPTKKVQVSSEEAGAMVACTEVEENGNSVVAPGNGAKMTSGTEPVNTIPAKKRKRKLRELKNSTTEENGDSVVAPGNGAKMTSGTEPGNMIPAKKRKRKSRELKNSTTEENGDSVVAPGKGANMTSGTEPENTVPAKKRKRKSRELKNSTTEENGDAVVAPGKGAKITSWTEPGNMVLAMKRKRKSRELNNSTVEENSDAVVAPLKGAKKLRPKRPTKKVQVSFEEAGAMVACTKVENTGSHNDSAMVVAKDVNAETCPHPIQNGVSEDTLSHHSRATQTTQENAGELSMLHLINCESVNLEQHVP